MEPCGTFVEPFGLVEPLWNPRGTLWNPLKPYLAPDHPTPLAEPRPPRSPCRTWCNSGGILVELWRSFCGTFSNHPGPPRSLAEPGGTLVQPLWNLTAVEPWRKYLKPPLQNLVKPCWNLVEPSCNLTLNPVEPWWVEPDLKPPQTPAALAEPTSNHPGPPRSPRRTWWHPGGTLEPSWNLASTHPRPPRSPRRTWWNPGGTLVDHYPKPPRTIPQPLQNLVEAWWNLTSHPGPPRSPCRT